MPKFRITNRNTGVHEFNSHDKARAFAKKHGGAFSVVLDDADKAAYIDLMNAKFNSGELVPLPAAVWAEITKALKNAEPEKWWFFPAMLDDETVTITQHRRDIYAGNKRTKMSFSSFLKEYIPNLDNTTLQRILAIYSAANTVVEIGTTAEAFVRAYSERGVSCMGGEYAYFSIHPMAVYAYDDIGIATISKKNRIVARALVNMKTKQFDRVYGTQGKDRQRLEGWLFANQFNRHEAPLLGAHIRMVPHSIGGPGSHISGLPHTVLCPYIDGYHFGVHELGTDRIKLVNEKEYLDFRNRKTHAVVNVRNSTCLSSLQYAAGFSL